MNSIYKRVDTNHKEIFEKYHDTFYRELHGWRDYQLTSAGFGEWYYDCILTDEKAKILGIGCGDGKFLFFLHKKGYTDIEALEIAPQQAEEARKHVEYQFIWLKMQLPFYSITLPPTK